MKSNIKYISDEKESKIKKDVIDLIRERQKNEPFAHSSSYYYYLLIYSKYIIERDKLNASNIIDGDIEELLDKLKSSKVFKENDLSYLLKGFEKNKIYEFIKKVIYEDYEVVKYEDRVVNALMDPKKKNLIVSTDSIGFVTSPNVDVYIYNTSSNLVTTKFKVYNEIIGINNSYYLSSDDIDFKKYDKVFFYNTRYATDKTLLSLKHYYYDINKFFMICNYSEISKYKESLLNLKSIIMDKDKVYIEYMKLKELRTVEEIRRLEDSDIKVCLKELTNLDDDKLKEVVDSYEEKENVCIYASLKDFKNNSHRLGFKAYNRKFDLDRTKVLRLIDYNEKITSDIEKLNKEISQRIDEIVVR